LSFWTGGPSEEGSDDGPGDIEELTLEEAQALLNARAMEKGRSGKKQRTEIKNQAAH